MFIRVSAYEVTIRQCLRDEEFLVDEWHSGLLLAGFFITILIRGVSWCASTLLKSERVVD